MIRRLGAIAAFAFAALALPVAAAAQEASMVTPVTPAATEAVATAPAAQQALSGPTLDAATVGFQRELSENRTVAVAQARRGTNSTALMIVGTAAFLAGAVIGGDAGTLIMIGGAGIGLYGLYHYLQ